MYINYVHETQKKNFHTVLIKSSLSQFCNEIYIQCSESNVKDVCFPTYTVLDMGVLTHTLTQNPARVTDISHRLVSVPLRDSSQTPWVQSKHYK